MDIGAQGFDAVEVFATRTAFDYHNVSAVSDLQAWLAEAGLALHSVHAPLGESWSGGRWNSPFSLASVDNEARARAMAETERALQIARRIPFKALVVHLGVPRWSPTASADNGRDAARRSVEALQTLAEPLGVQIAIEVAQNELSRAGSLVHFIDEVIDSTDVGICLDFGHAHIDGDLVETIETVSEHVIAVDVHDNNGRADDHLLPFDGTIEWPAALTAVQKIGYEGVLMFEINPRGSTRETLAKAKRVREKMERMLAS